MLQKTKGIVLRNLKYGETSIVVSIFTESFGVQSYLVNGVRTTSKKGSSKGALFQPAAILELVAYHSEFKNLQRLKEYKWDVLYQNIYSDVIKNAVALFIIEHLTKCLKQPEPNANLFYFTEDALQHLDEASPKVTANFPLYFALHLPFFFGFRISNNKTIDHHYLDLREGSFTIDQPNHPHYLQDIEAEIVSDVLKVMHPSELDVIILNQESRRRVLHALEAYYVSHVPEFGTLKTLPVLQEIMS